MGPYCAGQLRGYYTRLILTPLCRAGAYSFWGQNLPTAPRGFYPL